MKSRCFTKPHFRLNSAHPDHGMRVWMGDSLGRFERTRSSRKRSTLDRNSSTAIMPMSEDSSRLSALRVSDDEVVYSVSVVGSPSIHCCQGHLRYEEALWGFEGRSYEVASSSLRTRGSSSEEIKACFALQLAWKGARGTHVFGTGDHLYPGRQRVHTRIRSQNSDRILEFATKATMQ